MDKEYYLGLDMGTSSVGWAVTTSDYDLVRAKGKDLWGVRLFDKAQTAVERRNYRAARRRRKREIARLGFLKSVFAQEIEKVDEGFFVRLEESKFYMEDRSEMNQQKFALFSDKNYTDREYYQQFPTVFHLRKALLENPQNQAFDIRLVYLAIASLYKRRGHFLNDILDETDNEFSMGELFAELKTLLNDYGITFNEVDISEFQVIMSEKGISKSKMLEDVLTLTGITKKDKVQFAVWNLICGMTVKLKNLFGEEILAENTALSICFRNANYDEKAVEVLEAIGEEYFNIIECIKEIHDKVLLANIMKGYKYLSQARVASYEEHQKDLKLLKKVLKKYDMISYNEMFRKMKEGSYSAYVGSVNSTYEKERRINGDRSRDTLYKNIKNVFEKLPEDDFDIQYIMTRMENEEFLPKQLTFENGVIPNQVHLKELKKILKNAESYLPFLKETDETGLSISDKIVQVYKFKIPYYVGPLGDRRAGDKGVNAWSKRISEGKIYPWNLEEKIDIVQSRQDFIERMVRHCTYLSGNSALPKKSYLYEKYQLLNELNNLKIRGEKPSVEVKQGIYEDLFQAGKKVTLKKLYEYLVEKKLIDKGEMDAISGIDGGFKCSLTTVNKFQGIFGEQVHSDQNRKVIEDIVFLGTVFGQEKKLFRNTVKEKYSDILTEADIKRIAGFKFEGWGRFSKEFLLMEGASKEDGEIRSIIRGLWETNDNLMELLSSKYTYIDSLNEMVGIAEKPLKEWTINDLEGKYLSPSVKRMVWQTLSVVKELEEVLGEPPKRIFVEMAREDAEKKRTVSRKQKLLELYKAIEKEAATWKKEIEDRMDADFNSKKLYLYYIQKGKCMYTGEEIDLDELMVANGKYDIDHIYPRHFIKDDSLENNLVLVNKNSNAYKSDDYPLTLKTQNSMKEYWRYLKNHQLITEEKYNRLTRTKAFTPEEKAAFVSRQLVETRQGTKAITEIFSQAFRDTEIVFSKAGVVSDFRQKFGIYKARSLNNLHHAHDAYLNVIVGNVYYVKFTKNPLNFMREAEKRTNESAYKYNMDKMYKWNVNRGNEVAWNADPNIGTIIKVKKVLARTTPLVTRMAVEIHGGITRKTTIWNKKKAKPESYYPVKTSDPRLLDVTKYGGVSDVTTAGYTLVEYIKKGKKVRSLEQLPVYLGRVEYIDENILLNFLKDKLGTEAESDTVRVCKKFIPMKSLIKYNGFYYYLCGKTGSRLILESATELILNQKLVTYVKKLEKAIAMSNYEEKDENKNNIITKEANIELYDVIKNKYESSIYRNEGSVAKNIFIKREGEFKELDIEKQCQVLSQIILHMNRGLSMDLSYLNESKNCCKMLINKNVSVADEIILITQSITGIYRAEINLLQV